LDFRIPLSEAEQYGAAYRVRTGDINLGKVALYQRFFKNSNFLGAWPLRVAMLVLGCGL
jgi:hypothetical protein